MSQWHDVYWRFADEDLAAARSLRGSSPRLAVYLAAQATEKWLKAILASKINFDNKYAEALAHDHNLQELVRRVAAIFAAGMEIPGEFLAKQGLDILDRFPARTSVLNNIRYPRWNSKSSRADGWWFTSSHADVSLKEADCMRIWLLELKKRG
jgi:HEPN domain-containing protein